MSKQTVETQSPEQLRAFYETEYARDTAISTIPADDNFLYAQTLAQLRPHLKPGLRVLDLGCNDGNLSLYMARRGCDVLGIDLARNAVDCARRSAAAHGIRNATFESLDFLTEWTKPAHLDLVLCSHVIEHVPNDAAFARKIYEALKPGGRLILFTPTQYSTLMRITKLFTGRFKHDEDVGHLRRYTKQSIHALICGAGLEVERLAWTDGLLRDWFIVCRPLRVFTKVFSKPLIRTVFNACDGLTARAVPATVCVHARRR